MINVKDVSFAYSKKRVALDHVSLHVPEKNIVGLLGPNGGGKTTLFKIISSLIRHYDGTVEICGLDQKKNLRQVLSQIGVVFQSPSLDKKLTVIENLRYQGALYGVEKNKLKSRIDSFLNMLSMAERKDDLVEELSGGLARRVEIIKSLLHQPKILILDEPSTGLDMGVRIDLWNLLTQIRESENVTVLLTTHFIEEADRCDSISVLDQGKIICSGSPETLKQQLSFKQFHVKPKDPSAIQTLLRDKFQISSDEKNGFLHFKTRPEDIDIVSNTLAPKVTELTYRDPSLEDVFLHYTGRNIRDVQP